jgi:hypothetical protein
MGYSAGAVEMMMQWFEGRSRVPTAILELGDQEINADVPEVVIRRLSTVVHDTSDKNLSRSRRMAGVFKGSIHTYRCVDLFPGEDTIVADLNIYVVPDEWRERFDIITNLGTTEHILDQVNVFRAMHDFANVGGLIHHSVPCLGYFNHGLFAYNPAFFLFLAEANAYEIEAMGISAPHLEHTLPESDALPSASAWRGRVISSGMLNVRLRKTNSAPFRLFTDHDVTKMGAERQLPEKYLTFLRDRYILRIVS